MWLTGERDAVLRRASACGLTSGRRGFILRARNRQTNRRTLHSASSSDTSLRGPSTWSSWILAASYHACMDHADPRRRFARIHLLLRFLLPSYFLVPFSPPLLDLDPLQQKCSFSEFSEFSVCPGEARTKSELSLHQMAVRAFFGQKIRAVRPSNGCADDLRTKIRAERLSNGYPSQGPTEPPLHRNSALLVKAHWSVASSCRGITPDFGPRPLCVLESCLSLSRTATHGQSPSAGVDVPSLTYSLCWRSHLRREALRPRLCLPNSLS